MSVRGQPSSDPADACPFVAFEEERDERSTRPDHRHRCYAELRPAPRALAHQEAYCLSPSFADCPTFRDWARREAARARPPVRSPDETQAEPLAYDAGYGRRQSDWTAPPPWSVADGSTASATTGGQAATAGAAGAAAGAGAASADAPDTAPAADTPGFLTSRDRSTSAAEGAGLAASAAYAAAGPSPAGTGEDEDSAAAASTRAPTASPSTPVAASAARGSRPQPAAERAAHDGRDGSTAPRSVSGPSWERPHRYEAYPTLRTRVGLPGIPRLALAAIAVLVAAVALFLLPTLVLRPGSGGGAGGSSTPSPSGSSEASASIAPTPVPSPTALVHVVKQGETLSGIAALYKVPLPDLIAANKQIANPDKLQPGDRVNIPTPAPSDVLDVGGPSASPSG